MYFSDIKSQGSSKCGILSLPDPLGLNKTPSTLLIIDDDTEMLLLLKDFFESHGYVVKTFSDSIEASKDIVDNQVIITDYSMPGMNGLEVIHHIQQKNQNIKTILISAYNSRVTEELALQRGAYAFFAKPFSLMYLKQKVDQALNAS